MKKDHECFFQHFGGLKQAREGRIKILFRIPFTVYFICRDKEYENLLRLAIIETGFEKGELYYRII